MSELTFSQDDLMNPGPWLERQSQEALKEWLRRALWTRQTLPVFNANSFEISELLKDGSSSLKIRVRKVVPELLQEWGRDDPLDVLDNLLIVSARLRCAAADVVIALIISERLPNRPEAIPLRQRCLAVLSGFGCTDKTVHIFERYIGDIKYATICYPALYRYDLAYAANALPRLIKLFKGSAVMDELDSVIRDLAKDLKTPKEAADVLINYLRVGERNELVDILDRFRIAGIFTTNMLLEIDSKQRQELSHLLLIRSAHATLPKLLDILEKVGANIYSDPDKKDETIDFRVKNKETKRNTTNAITASNKLDTEILETIQVENQRRARETYSKLNRSALPESMPW